MSRTVRMFLPLLVLLLPAAACGNDDGVPGASTSAGTPARVDGFDVLRWGDGDDGVVLAHGAAFDAASWQDQAVAIAERGNTVLAVEDITPDAIVAAVEELRADGADQVALVGGSAGADAILRLSAEEPGLGDQLVLLSPNSVVDGLGEEPKLFIASEGESVADVPEQLVRVSPGDDNEALLVGGDAHAQNLFDTEQGPEVLAAVLERLDVG